MSDICEPSGRSTDIQLQSIISSTRFNFSGVKQMEIPLAGSRAYYFSFQLFDTGGSMEDPDGSIAIRVADGADASQHVKLYKELAMLNALDSPAGAEAVVWNPASGWRVLVRDGEGVFHVVYKASSTDLATTLLFAIQYKEETILLSASFSVEVSAFTGSIASVATTVTGIATTLGAFNDPSAQPNVAGTMFGHLREVQEHQDLIAADIGDASAATLGSLYGIVGNPAANSLTVTVESSRTALGTPEAALVDISHMIGVGSDAAGTAGTAGQSLHAKTHALLLDTGDGTDAPTTKKSAGSLHSKFQELLQSSVLISGMLSGGGHTNIKIYSSVLTQAVDWWKFKTVVIQPAAGGASWYCPVNSSAPGAPGIINLNNTCPFTPLDGDYFYVVVDDCYAASICTTYLPSLYGAIVTGNNASTNRMVDKVQILDVNYTTPAATGDTPLATVTTQRFRINAAHIVAKGNTVAHMTSLQMQIFRGATAYQELIAAVDATPVFLPSAGKYVEFFDLGGVIMDVGDVIKMSCVKSGGDTSDFLVSFMGRADVNGGYLAP